MEICPKCGGSKYTDALKEYNKGKPAWCMPRKGTDLHSEVLRIMNAPKKPTRKLRKAPAPAPAPARALPPLSEDQIAMAEAITREKERRARLKKDPEYQAMMKKEMARIKAELKRGEELAAKQRAINAEAYAERQKQARIEVERIKATDPKLYEELYGNVFKTSTAFD